MDSKTIQTLTRSIEQKLDRAFEQDLRPIQKELEYVRTDIDKLTRTIDQIHPIIRELRQESEQAKQEDYAEKANLQLIKDQLVRIQADMQVILQSLRQSPQNQQDEFGRPSR